MKAPQIEPEYTELQQEAEAFEGFFDGLAGVDATEPTEEKTPKPKAKTAPESPKAKTPTDEDEDESDADTDSNADADDEALLTDAVLSEEDEAEEGDDDADSEEATAEQVAALKKEHFKLREAKRTLKAELSAKDQLLAERDKQIAELTGKPGVVAMPEVSGAFAKVKTADDVTNAVEWLKAKDIELEDFLETGEETLEHPEFGTLDRKAARQARRWVGDERARAGDVKLALKEHAAKAEQLAEEARKRYPFVTNPNSRFNAHVLDAVKEEPMLNALPSKSLTLGRIVVGKLVEQASPEIRRQINALLLKPSTPSAASSPPSKPVRQATPPAKAPVSQAKPAERQRTNRDQALINGDMQAAEEWARGFIRD